MYSVMIHQPEYLPWTNLFVKAAFSDLFVLLDSVQYAKRTFQNRNSIKTYYGEKFLTVPLKKISRDTRINAVEVDNTKDWRRDHLRLIEDNYRHAPYFNEVMALFKPVYEQEWDSLSDINCRLIEDISRSLGLMTKFIRSSSFELTSKGSDLILDICKLTKAENYISGIGAKDYLIESGFEKNAISIVYVPPVFFAYEQCYKEKGFIKDLSIIDYIFNRGFHSFKEDITDNLNKTGIDNLKERIHG